MMRRNCRSFTGSGCIRKATEIDALSWVTTSSVACSMGDFAALSVRCVIFGGPLTSGIVAPAPFGGAAFFEFAGFRGLSRDCDVESVQLVEYARDGVVVCL